MLVGFTAVSLVGVIGYSLSGTFWIAIGFLLLLSAARPLYEPLVNGWLVVRVEPKVRATALSARDMFDSGGQLVGGPVIDAVGSAFSIRAALLTGAAVLVPAVLFLFGMERKAKTADRGEPRNEPITAGERG